MGFEEFRFSKRGENDCQYPDWEDWLKKRGILELSDAERLERGGDNFRFVCYGDVTELKLWSVPERRTG